MPPRVDLYTAIRVGADPVVDPATRERHCFGPYLDAEYYPFRAETWRGVNGLDYSRRDCSRPTHVVTIPESARLAVEILEGRAGVWDQADGCHRYVDADEMLKLARDNWRGLTLCEVGRD